MNDRVLAELCELVVIPAHERQVKWKQVSWASFAVIDFEMEKGS